jgi:hypothetical protein
VKTSTLSRLLIGLVIGLAIGFVYGWVFKPVNYIDTSPNSLREDYRAEYVLMVSEAYASDGDFDLALVRLAALGPQPPLDIVQGSLDYAIDNNFDRRDLDSLNQLAIQLRSLLPSPEIGGP